MLNLLRLVKGKKGKGAQLGSEMTDVEGSEQGAKICRTGGEQQRWR